MKFPWAKTCGEYCWWWELLVKIKLGDDGASKGFSGAFWTSIILKHYLEENWEK
jgi:hypothetical protein